MNIPVWIGVMIGIVFVGIAIAKIPTKPERNVETTPERLVAKPFAVANATVYEFRNSQGGTCVLAMRGDRDDFPIAIACMRQLPPLDYEDLPASTPQHRSY